MLLSKLFVRTSKESIKDEPSVNAQYLIRGWFIHKVMAWCYTYLPFGLRVLNKIEAIIRKHMQKVGTEIVMTALSPMEIRKKSDRLDTIDVLMKTSGANTISANKSSNEYILNPTHEDSVTPLVWQWIKSYKDLPISVFQFQSKFRNEARAKSGLLRGREFRMKDMYSFHRDKEDLMQYYDRVKQSYMDAFHELWLGEGTMITVASGWDFTDEFSHEFQTILPIGEDTLFIGQDKSFAYNQEVTPSQAPNLQDPNETMKPFESVFGENIVSVERLVEFFDIPAWKTVKTMLYIADDKPVACSVRGDYEINDLKLKKVLNCKTLRMMTEDEILTHTGAQIGYAGPIGLRSQIEFFADDSIANLINFECGVNQTNYHAINANRDRELPRPAEFHDFKLAKKWDIEPSSWIVYDVQPWCEIGNIFPLETRFSDIFGVSYMDETNQRQQVMMWCYGIGPSRIMGVIVEKYHDDKWIIRPTNIAPFDAMIVPATPDAFEEAKKEYLTRLDAWEDVCFDDRDLRFGEKMGDWELWGIPEVVIYGKKGREVKMRG